MNRSIRNLLLGSLTAATVSPATFAQSPWNRRVESIAVATDAAGRTSIVVYYGIQAEEPSAPINLGTEMTLLVNGIPLDVQTFPVIANPSSHSGCGGFCLTNQACFCCEVGGEQICGCGDWIAPAEGATASLRPKDEIMVILRPAPGAVPDDDQSDDVLVMTYHDKDIFWNRALESVDVTPTPGGDGLYDIQAKYRLSANYDGGLRLDTEVDLLVNGEPFAHVPSDGDNPTEWAQCIGNVCAGAPCAFDGGDVNGHCTDLPDFDCGCEADDANVLVLTAVPLEPDDIITVILRPAPGALPELPGFEEDDEEEGTIPDDCPADFDQNGIVEFADLLQLLAAWGPCAGCIEDLDGNDVVEFADLLLLLSAWGPCIDV